MQSNVHLLAISVQSPSTDQAIYVGTICMCMSVTTNPLSLAMVISNQVQELTFVETILRNRTMERSMCFSVWYVGSNLTHPVLYDIICSPMMPYGLLEQNKLLPAKNNNL